jgi:plastocyanin
VAAVVTLAALLGGWATLKAPVPAHAAAGFTVKMHDFKFILPDGHDNQAENLSVKAGDSVTWVWDEQPPPGDGSPGCDWFSPGPPLRDNCPGHTVTAKEAGPAGKPLFNSGLCKPPDGHPDQGATCPMTVTFDRSGTYHYYCAIHGGSSPNNPITHMDGTIVVTGAPEVGPQQSAASAGGVTILPGLPTAGHASSGAGNGLPAAPHPSLLPALLFAGLALSAAGLGLSPALRRP